LQAYNSIYKVDFEHSELVAMKTADVVSPIEDPQNSFTFFIQTTDDLNILFSRITQLFRQHYFSLKGNPLIVVQTSSLERLFNAKIQNLGLGNFMIINLETSNELVCNQTTQIQFNKWFNEGNINREFYFISKDLNEFNNWKKSLTQLQVNQLIHIFILRQQCFQLKTEKEQLSAKNSLLNESLSAIKIEYGKEVHWYKAEIENINKWYQSRYIHLPNWFLKLGCVFKVFKKK
jgi:hypothetical protein